MYRFCIERFGGNFVFFDTSTIQSGDKIPAEINRAIEECEVFIPIIGPKWDSVADENGCRLTRARDWVRREVATVLAGTKWRNVETPRRC